MRTFILLALLVFFSCESPTDTDPGDGDGSSNLQALTDEQLSIPFESCYGTDQELEDRTYTLNDSYFENKAIVVHYMTPWWAGCVADIPVWETTVSWAKEKYPGQIHIFSNLDDIGNPFSCEEIGENGLPDIPTYLDDGLGYDLFNINDAEDYPVFLFITKDKKIYQSIQGEPSQVTLQAYIDLLMQQ